MTSTNSPFFSLIWLSIMSFALYTFATLCQVIAFLAIDVCFTCATLNQVLSHIYVTSDTLKKKQWYTENCGDGNFVASWHHGNSVCNGYMYFVWEYLKWVNFNRLFCSTSYGNTSHIDLTHLPLDKMAAISQATFSNAFSWMKMYWLGLKFHWSLFPMIWLTTFEHWLR